MLDFCRLPCIYVGLNHVNLPELRWRSARTAFWGMGVRPKQPLDRGLWRSIPGPASLSVVASRVEDMTTSDELPATAGECVAMLEELEALKAHLAARQARLTARLDDLQADASDRSVGAQVALARHESPHRGGRLLSMAAPWSTTCPTSSKRSTTG